MPPELPSSTSTRPACPAALPPSPRCLALSSPWSLSPKRSCSRCNAPIHLLSNPVPMIQAPALLEEQIHAACLLYSRTAPISRLYISLSSATQCIPSTLVARKCTTGVNATQPATRGATWAQQSLEPNYQLKRENKMYSIKSGLAQALQLGPHCSARDGQIERVRVV